MKKFFGLSQFFNLSLTAILLLVLVTLASACHSDSDDATESYLMVNNTALSFFDGNTTLTVNVSSNIQWEIYDIPTWLNVSPTAGKGDGTITVTARSIADSEERLATMTIKGSNIIKTISVTQTGKAKDNNPGTPDKPSTPDPNGLCPDANHPHMIDLGTGVKWACCNVDASSQEDFGGYYAWGEIEKKDRYSTSNYEHIINPDIPTWANIGTNISGTQYDVAHKKWHDTWRMPTKDQFEKLVLKTSHEWISINGINGWKFMGNGQSIFFPATGSGKDNGVVAVNASSYLTYYWTSNLVTTGNFAYFEAFLFQFSNRSPFTSGSYIASLSRWYGYPVRPVAY
ncbi:MAG: hypothetical protein IJQ59_09370 [Bacteroidaceae bacterium]|nr:hypothetical protein [Bacteroidaceae bacterium]